MQLKGNALSNITGSTEAFYQSRTGPAYAMGMQMSYNYNLKWCIEVLMDIWTMLCCLELEGNIFKSMSHAFDIGIYLYKVSKKVRGLYKSTKQCLRSFPPQNSYEDIFIPLFISINIGKLCFYRNKYIAPVRRQSRIGRTYLLKCSFIKQ